MKCQICSRKAVDKDFCELHLKAYESITKKYTAWKNALEISWREYLSEIARNPLTGEWAKEVAEHLIKSGESQNVVED
ncbi:MAG: hypothetical protein ACPLZC_01565 [Candidatus Bathyarchaeales archaeon]